MITFDDLDLIEPLRRAIADQGYERPTPIQAQAIPALLEGRDMLGCAQTGTGKTAAFALPVLQLMHQLGTHSGRRPIRALILSPTRELAAQIGDSFETYGRHLHLRSTVIFGGVNQKPQVETLRRGVDILVATPGRLLDLHGQGYVEFGEVEFFVLDEADRMLDMGFIHDIRRVLKLLPRDRQNLLFSATMPRPIAELASSFLDDPVRVEVTPQATTVERIDQAVMFVDKADKRQLLADLLRGDDVEQAIVFTRTKHGANRLVKQLATDGIESAAIHGNKSQNARERALDGFRSGKLPVLVATDVASRGIDVEGVSHVFNYDLPNEPESYVHRIGRTGRAGRSGIAISFCDTSEGDYLRDIERTIGDSIPVVDDHAWHCAAAVPPPGRGGRSGGSSRSSGGGGGGRSGGGGGGGRSGGGGGGGRSGGGGGGRSGGGGGGRNGGGGGGGRSQDDRAAQPAQPRTQDGAGAQPSGEGGDGQARRRRRRRGGRGRSGGGRGPGPSSHGGGSH